MALVQFSGNIASIIGRTAGSCFQRVKGGIIMRTQSSNLFTSRNQNSRTKINAATMQAAWRALSVQDRNLWEVYASFRNRPTRKQTSSPIGGQGTFMLENSIRILFSQAGGTISPVILSTPIITPPPQSVTINSMTTGGADLIITTDYSVTSADEFLFLYITRPLLPSQISIWNKKRLLPKINDDGNSQAIEVPYLAAFGILPTVGQVVNTEIFLYDKTLNTFGVGNAQRITIS